LHNLVVLVRSPLRGRELLCLEAGQVRAGEAELLMLDKAHSRPDLLLLLSLLLVIVMHPVLDHGNFRRVILGVLMFAPVYLAVIRLSRIKGWVRPSVLLMVVTLACAVASTLISTPTLIGMKWVSLALFFGMTVVGLFPYLRYARSVTDAHLYTAISIYLLLGMLWFALYSAIDTFYPGSIVHTTASLADRPASCCISAW
jgi:hypothetical protein